MATASKKKEKRQARTVDAGRRLAEHTSGGKLSFRLPKGVSLYAPKKPGERQNIEIIPFEVTKDILKYTKKYAEPGDWYFEQTFYAHGAVGPNKDSVCCPAKTFNQPCPICEYRDAISLDPKQKKLADKLRPSQRQLYLVYDHANENKGVQLWEVAYKTFGEHLETKIQSAKESKQAKYRRFADPEEGMTLEVVPKEKSFATDDGQGGKFLEFVVDEISDREKPLPEKLFEHGLHLDQLVNLMEYEKIDDLFRQAGPPAKKKKKDEDDDEDDDKDAGTSEEDEGDESDDDEEEDGDDGDGDEDTEDGDDSIEEGDKVTFTDDEGEDQEGIVISVKKDKAVVKVGKKKVKVDLDELTKAEEEEDEDDSESEDSSESDEDDESDDSDDEESDDDETDDDDEDEDNESDEDEDGEEEAELEPGDDVTWVYKGKTRKGVIKSIKNKMAKVAVDGKDEPAFVKLDELAKAEEEPFKDKEDDGWPDDDDDKPKGKKNKKGKK